MGTIKRECIEPNCRILTTRTRCPEHQREQWKRQRSSKVRQNQAKYTPAWRALSRMARTAWISSYGLVCPGWERGPHDTDRLVLDHVEPGSLRLGVMCLCISCNSTKQTSRVDTDNLEVVMTFDVDGQFVPLVAPRGDRDRGTAPRGDRDRGTGQL